MERAVTYSDHSTTVTTRYFTQATHKSYGPMTQLLPGPQCPNVTHVPTVLLQTSSPLFTPPSLHPFTPLIPSFLSCTASLSLSTSTPSSTSLFIISLTLTFSVCLSDRLPACLPVCLSYHALHKPFRLSLSLSGALPCVTYAETGNPSLSRCGSCPLHVVWGWTFEEPFRHLSLSPAFSLNTATNAVSMAGTLASAAEINEKRNLYLIPHTDTCANIFMCNCRHIFNRLAPVCSHQHMHTLVLHPMLGLTYSPKFPKRLSDQGM